MIGVDNNGDLNDTAKFTYSISDVYQEVIDAGTVGDANKAYDRAIARNSYHYPGPFQLLALNLNNVNYTIQDTLANVSVNYSWKCYL